MISRIARRVALALGRLLPGRERADLRWWERRARRAGAHSVLHSGHAPDETDQVDDRQKEILFPMFRRRLRGDERLVLDFGCGPGRFTPDLADLIGGQAIGADPIQSLLDLAPRSGNVEYRLLRNGRIPLEDGSANAIWICLVLTCITDKNALERAVAEIRRVLREDGLLFLVENTTSSPDTRHLRFRSIEDYRALFPFVALEHEGDYKDLGERISILAGRKQETKPGA